MTDQDNKPGSLETIRLYFEDAYRTEFEAEVMARPESQGRPVIVLDRTCFYPESGGQPSDKGMIEGVRVAQVLEEGSAIFHFLEGEVPAAKVTCRIDWPTRFDHMQQHTGQHILSQAFFELMKGETMSFHLGESLSTLEIGVPKITDEEVEKVEELANRVIFEDREVRTYFVSEDLIQTVPLRKPPKKKGLIRVVEVAGFDYSACGGTHCRRAGEVGMIKITRWDKIRENLRFEFVCGRRALRDYAAKNRILRQLGGQLSVGEQEVPASLERLLGEAKSLKKKMKKMQERLAEFEAQETIQKSKADVIRAVLLDKTPEEAKFLALNIIKRGNFTVLYGVRGEARDHLILAASDKSGRDMRRLVPAISSMIKARGGGSPSLVELVSEERLDLEAVLGEIYEILIKNELHS